jgi:hypothetical protein
VRRPGPRAELVVGADLAAVARSRQQRVIGLELERVVAGGLKPTDPKVGAGNGPQRYVSGWAGGVVRSGPR